MLSNLLRLYLAVLLVLAGGIAWLCGARPAIVLIVMACAPFAVLAVLVPASFVVARVRPSAAWLREYAGFVRISLFAMPFSPGPVRRAPPSPTATVLLVHGYACNRGAFSHMAGRLQAEGFLVESHNLEPVHGNIDSYAPALSARIDSLARQAPGGKIDVVCHSMGGLAMRVYLRAHGVGKIARLVTLGTPHGGTRLAYWGLGTNVHQMRPGSAWLRQLEADERGQPRPCVTTIMSDHDNIVAPQVNARLQGADNVALHGLGHVELLFHDEAFATVMRILREPARL